MKVGIFRSRKFRSIVNKTDPLFESAESAINRINRMAAMKDRDGSTSPGHLLSLFERKICKMMTDAASSRKNTHEGTIIQNAPNLLWGQDV